MAVIREVYKDESAQATTADKKLVLAKKFLEKAADNKDDPAGQFVLLRVGRNLASQAGSVETAFQVVEAMEERFWIDALAAKLDVLTKAAKVMQKPEEHKRIVKDALHIVDEAIGKDEFTRAGEAAQLAVAAARKSKTPALLRQAQAAIKHIGAASERFQEVVAARRTLQDKPADPDASLLVGKYLCFTKGDWTGGFPMLARGNDPDLKALAQKEASPPTGAAEEADLADRWWNLAETSETDAKKPMQARAQYWYERALPGLKCLAKEKVQKRLLELTEKSPRPPRSPASKPP